MDKTQFLNKATEFRKDGSIDVIGFSNSLGINVFSENNLDKSAEIRYDKNKGTFSIYVKSGEPLTRQRFSIAHELSHFVLHKEIIESNFVVQRSEPKKFDQKEKEADELATELLMPKDKIKEFINNNSKEKISKSFVEKLASYFKVSRYVAVIRLRELDYYVPFLDFS